jgi:hypothetical protein
MKYSVVKISDIKDDNKIFRIDADFFQPSHLSLMKNVKSKNIKEKESTEKRFSKAKFELDRINEKIQPFKVNYEYILTSTEGKWFQTSETYESRF